MTLYDARNYQWAEVHYRTAPDNPPPPAVLGIALWDLISRYWPFVVFRPSYYLCPSERQVWQYFMDRFINCFELSCGDLYLVEDITKGQHLDRYGFQAEYADGFLHLTRQIGGRFTITYPRLTRSQANIFDAFKRVYEVTYALAGVL